MLEESSGEYEEYCGILKNLELIVGKANAKLPNDLRTAEYLIGLIRAGREDIKKRTFTIGLRFTRQPDLRNLDYKIRLLEFAFEATKDFGEAIPDMGVLKQEFSKKHMCLVEDILSTHSLKGLQQIMPEIEAFTARVGLYRGLYANSEKIEWIMENLATEVQKHYKFRFESLIKESEERIARALDEFDGESAIESLDDMLSAIQNPEPHILQNELLNMEKRFNSLFDVYCRNVDNPVKYVRDKTKEIVGDIERGPLYKNRPIYELLTFLYSIEDQMSPTEFYELRFPIESIIFKHNLKLEGRNVDFNKVLNNLRKIYYNTMARVSSNELKPEAISPSLQYIEDLLYICVPGMSDEELTEFENYKDNMISTYVKLTERETA